MQFNLFYILICNNLSFMIFIKNGGSMSTVANVGLQIRSLNTSCLSRVINCVCSNTTTAKTVKVAALIIGVALYASVCFIPMSASLTIALACVSMALAAASAYSLIISAVSSRSNIFGSDFNTEQPGIFGSNIIGSDFNTEQPGVIRGATLYTTFADVRARPAYYLDLVTQNFNGLPARVRLINGAEQHALGDGIRKEFLSKLIEYLIVPASDQERPTIRLNEEKFPMLESGDNRQTYKNLGMLYSLIDQENACEDRTFQTGPLFHERFFEIVKKVAIGNTEDDLRIAAARGIVAADEGRNPIWLPLILERGSEQALQDYVRDLNLKNPDSPITIEDARDHLQTAKENMDAVVNAARAFYDGATSAFQFKIKSTADSANLARNIQGEPISADALLGALNYFSDQIPQNYQTWIREKISSSDEKWRMRFVSAITGCRALPPNKIIIIRAANAQNQANCRFELHTCFSSIDVVLGLGKDAFLEGLEGVLGDGYNIL